jgi:hypothetical protein
MGVGYDRNVSQFSKGEYYNYFNASSPEDDIAIVGGTYLGFRADDHGNTDATATALGGWMLSGTGIIGSTADVDVVKITAGLGPMSITVAPWHSPGDTAGGNLDVLLQLVNSSGTVIATANDTSTTAATIAMPLTPGDYYLHVSGTGVGTPLNNPPSGYTGYGSLGQWFLDGTVVSPVPLATATLTPVTTAGATTYRFTVTYTDDIAVIAATIGDGDVAVTGPNGYAASASLVSIDTSGNGTPRTATYQIPAAGGTWSYRANGSYTVTMNASAVSDGDAHSVVAGPLGAFSVSCPITPGPGSGILREWFDGISGSTIASLTSDASYPGKPTGDAIEPSFEAPLNRADDYGTRMRGYFIAPVTGDYTFVIASDATSELWLSTSIDPGAKTRIAWVATSTASRQWNKEANQTSSPIPLIADRRYYIEVLHKASTGSDNLAVGVVLPNAAVEEPIGGDRLDPFHRPGEDGGSPQCGVGGLGALLAIGLLASALRRRRG